MRFSVTAVTPVAIVLSAVALVAASDISSAAESASANIETKIAALAPRLPQQPVAADEGLTLGTDTSAAVSYDSLPDSDSVQQTVTDAPPATTLAALVEKLDDTADMDAQTRCLATAVYYEARSESLAGKLAVARVIINRTQSGRFPTSLCGVVTQPGQFSFVRGGQIPTVSGASARLWPGCVAIARIAVKDAWKSKAEGALYFHAARVSPSWGKQQLARIDNHIFYR